MKRILLSVLIAVLFSFPILTACGSKDSGTEDSEKNTETLTEEDENDEAGDQDEKEDDDDEDEGGADSVFSTGNNSLVDDSSDEKNISKNSFDDDELTEGGWQEAYLKYLDENPAEDGGYSYALIYVDDDDIPELVIDAGYEAAGCQILTYHNGKTDVLQTSRLYFTYIERENLLDNCDGHMGYYYDFVYSIKDGKWTEVFIGEYSGFDENGGDDYDEETGRYICTEYLINGKATDAKEYYKELKKVYDLSKGRDVTSFILYDDLISYLKTGKMSSEDHRYELFVKDCTWDEARTDCEKKGGYLACMTNDKEFETVEDLIRKEDKTNICFYVGGMRDDNYNWIWIEPGLTQNSCLNNNYGHWLDGGPSYTDTLSDGTKIDETCVELIYRKSDDKFYLNDVTNDVPDVYPSFKGRIGYICEFSD